MIVFDGDSTLVFEDFGVPKEESWPYLVSKHFNKPYVNFAKQQKTAEKCRVNIDNVIRQNPSHYILQVGQWSSRNESLESFEANVRKCIEEVRRFSSAIVTLVCVDQIPQTNKYADVMYRLSFIYDCQLFQICDPKDSWFVGFPEDGHFNGLGCAEIFKQFLASEIIK